MSWNSQNWTATQPPIPINGTNVPCYKSLLLHRGEGGDVEGGPCKMPGDPRLSIYFLQR
jgi:hypothetical protein